MEIFKKQREEGDHTEHHTEHETQLSQERTADNRVLDTYSFWTFLAMLFLLPIVFIPSISIPFQFTKTILVFAGVLIALLITLIARLKEGRLTLPSHYLLYAVWALPVVYFISALFSESPKASFLGQALEIDTFAFITLMAVFATLVVMVIRSKEQVLSSYLILFTSFIVLWVFQGLRLIFGPDFLAFNTLTLATSNVFGKWNDLSIFFGLATVMSLVTLASLKLSATYKRVLYVMLIVSLFFLAVVNFTITWAIVGLFALGFLVHSVGITRFNWKKAQPLALHEEVPPQETSSKGAKNISAASAIVFVIALLFVGSSFTENDRVGNALSNTFNISQIEARPSWTSTIDIARASYTDNAFLGSGPNTFVKEWVTSRPQELNNSIFWNADFVSGIGIIPTAFISVGLIGGLIWLLIFASFVYSGFRSLILNSGDNRFSYYITLSSFLAGLYLWLLMIFYTPNVVLVTLAFFFTGIYLASLRHNSAGKLRERTYVFAGNPKTGFASVFTLTFLLLVTIVAGWSAFGIYRSAVAFQSGVIALNVDGDIDRAQDLIAKSASIYETDRQYRLLADISTARVIALQSATGLSEDELREQFQFRLAQAIEAGQKATELDPNNYQNWLSLGRVYQSVVPLRIEGAYENAQNSFDQALELNPNGPATYLTMARLEVANGDTLRARDHIASALQLKSNYTEAIFLLSQLEISEGNVDEAIASIEAAAILTQNNPVIFFQLGLLKYNQTDYEGAQTAFRRAVQLSNDYANALYFLGLTEDRLGNTDDAIVFFERVSALNPNNEEVISILENLNAGRAPFAGQTPEPPAIPDELPFEESPEGETADTDTLDIEEDEEAGEGDEASDEEEPTEG